LIGCLYFMSAMFPSMIYTKYVLSLAFRDGDDSRIKIASNIVTAVVLGSFGSESAREARLEDLSRGCLKAFGVTDADAVGEETRDG
jgi:hypothetical protein